MSRTIKKAVPCWYRKESKTYRKPHYKAYRNKCNRLVREGEEVMPENTKTSGYLTH